MLILTSKNERKKFILTQAHYRKITCNYYEYFVDSYYPITNEMK